MRSTKIIFGNVFTLLSLGILIAPQAGFGDTQVEFSSSLVLKSLFEAVFYQALIPVFVLTGVGLVLAHRLMPSLAVDWRKEFLVLMAISGCSFPLVATFSFTVWNPQTPGDYLGTLLLVSSGVSLTLMLGRAFFAFVLAVFPRRMAWVQIQKQ